MISTIVSRGRAVSYTHLSRGELQIIGATTVEEYRKHIEKDAALERRFQPITVEEPSEEETIAILKGIRKNYEQHHQVKITDEAVEAAATVSYTHLLHRKRRQTAEK